MKSLLHILFLMTILSLTACGGGGSGEPSGGTTTPPEETPQPEPDPEPNPPTNDGKANFHFYLDGDSNLVAVNKMDINSTFTLTQNGIAQTIKFYAQDANAIDVETVLIVTDGVFYRVDVNNSATPVVTQVSDATGINLCETRTFSTANGDHYLFYRNSDDCTVNPGQYFFVDLTMTQSESPVPVATLPFGKVDDNAGNITGWLMQQGSVTTYSSVDFATTTIVADPGNYMATFSTTSGNVILVGSDIVVYDPQTNTLGLPLMSLGAAPLSMAENDSYLYFVYGADTYRVDKNNPVSAEYIGTDSTGVVPSLIAVMNDVLLIRTILMSGETALIAMDAITGANTTVDTAPGLQLRGINGSRLFYNKMVAAVNSAVIYDLADSSMTEVVYASWSGYVYAPAIETGYSRLSVQRIVCLEGDLAAGNGNVVVIDATDGSEINRITTIPSDVIFMYGASHTDGMLLSGMTNDGDTDVFYLNSSSQNTPQRLTNTVQSESVIN
jgi:hypothetical protein